MSAAVLLALLGINLAGVKWIVRLQLLLLAVLAVSTLDFVIGTFTHLDPGRAGLDEVVILDGKMETVQQNVVCALYSLSALFIKNKSLMQINVQQKKKGTTQLSKTKEIQQTP